MNFLLKNLVEPALHRVGTWAGTFLAAQGLTGDDFNVVMAAIPVVLGFIADTIIRKVNL